jgi:hypothetical protein
VSRLYLSLLLVVGGCRCGAARQAAAPGGPPPIEVRDAAGAVSARVVPGRPCRATVEGVELLVGGPPLVAQQGAARWSGEDGANGTTLSRDGAPAARVYARQLFDAEGLPILRVLEDGSITDRASAIVRRATVQPATPLAPPAVRIGPPRRPEDGLTVTGTADVVLAAMLAAPEATPAVRAMVACHFLLTQAR